MDANKHTKRCSTSYVIRESQIQITMSYHYTPLRMANIRSTDTKYWVVCGAPGILVHCWWECKMRQPLWRIIWQFLTKLNIGLIIWHSPAITLIGVYPNESKTYVHTKTCPQMFIAVLLLGSTKIYLSRWMDTFMWSIQTTEY